MATVLVGFIRPLTLAAILVIASPATAQPNDVMKLPEWARSVVKIWIQCKTAGGSLSDPVEGAGVIIHKDGYVLTAAHVGKDCINKPGFTVQIGPIDQIYFEPAKKLAASLVARQIDNIPSNYPDPKFTNERDLALYKIDGFTLGNSTVAKISSKTIIPGEALSVLGFPNLPVWFTPSHQGAATPKKAGFSVYKTHLMSVAANASGVPFRLHYGSGGLEGMSGGPVFNDSGELVGIHSTRAAKGAFQILVEACDTPDDNGRKCQGNAVVIPKSELKGAKSDRTIYVNMSAVKNILENFGWATSVNGIPPDWLEKLPK